MGWDKLNWRFDISILLFELSNFEFQRRSWCGRVENYYSNYFDLNEHFEDAGVPNSIDSFIKEGFVSVYVANKLKEIERELFNFEDKVDDPNDNESYWNHPDWKKLSSKARLLFNEEFRDDFIRLGKPYTDWLEKWPV